MITRCLVSLLVAFWCAVVEAGTFEGLEPGISTKAEADRVLGLPIRETVPGIRYDYEPSKYGASRISIQFDKQTAAIVKIDLYLEQSYAKADYRVWFELSDPTSTASDDDGNLVERYLPQAISLHYAGPDDSFPVAFFRHFDRGPKAQIGPAPTDTAADAVVPGVERKPFLGASFIANREGQGVEIREIYPNSPADRAGLRPGDVILEFGEHAMYGGATDAWEFVALIAAAPTGRPIRLVVERGTSRAVLQATLELRDTQDIGKERRRLALESYQRGESVFRQGKYEQAIPHLERAYSFNSSDGRTLELLGYCYLREREYGEALRAYKWALQRTPDSATVKYFIGGCHDALGNAQQAVEFYRQYLSSDDADKKKRKYATRRVHALTSQPEQQTDWGEVFADIIDAVRQEMDDDG